MNPYTQNLNRMEFIVTYACTGRCKHCSEGDHTAAGRYIDGDAAAQAVYKVCKEYNLASLMTFGGEPLLHCDVVCKIHAAAREGNIPKRQLITNGFFSKEEGKITAAASRLAQSQANDILLSVDAFHQETIPLEPVKVFAEAVKAAGIPIRTHPAWLVNMEAENPYNHRTNAILREFERLGISASEGNIIFPSGNALKYLKQYFDADEKIINPYTDHFEDVRTLCIDPCGNVLGGNIYQNDILDIIENYAPEKP